jgi:hypothetical protein
MELTLKQRETGSRNSKELWVTGEKSMRRNRKPLKRCPSWCQWLTSVILDTYLGSRDQDDHASKSATGR